MVEKRRTPLAGNETFVIQTTDIHFTHSITLNISCIAIIIIGPIRMGLMEHTFEIYIYIYIK